MEESNRSKSGMNKFPPVLYRSVGKMMDNFNNNGLRTCREEETVLEG